MSTQTYYGLVRVRVDPDGLLVPLSYTVGGAADLDHATLVNHEYTVAFCTLAARSPEDARALLKEELRAFDPLLRQATPDAWFSDVDERGEDGPRFARPVVCAWCSNRHRSAVPPGVNTRNTQGDGCAVSVFQVTEEVMRFKGPDYFNGFTPRTVPELRLGEWLAKGHYGSSGYDCELYRFVQNPPTAPAHPVCDNCIGERLCADDLEQIEGNFP